MIYNVCDLEKQGMIVGDYRTTCARLVVHGCLVELGLIQVIADVLLKSLLLSHALLAISTCRKIQRTRMSHSCLC
jgi:hypothetical protein